MRSPLRSIIRSTAALAPLAALGAAEIDDLRLVGGYTWQRFRTDSDTTITVGSASGDFSGTDSGSEDQAWRVGGEWMASLRELADAGAPIIGVALSYQHSEVADSAGTVAERVDGLVLDALPGWAVPLADGLHLEGCGVLGIGWEREALHFGSAAVTGEDTDASLSYEFGARAGLYWTTPSRWQVGVVAEYLWGGANHSFEVVDAAHDSTFSSDVHGRTNGFSALASLGYRLR